MIRAQFRAQSRKMNRNITHKTLIIKDLCEMEAAGVEPASANIPQWHLHT